MGNHRMLGAETAQALPSVPMWYALIRGAGKQYGILWFGNASVWNRWGAKDLSKPNAEDTNAPGYWSGPTSGTSMSLLRRLWYVLTMYGSVLMSYEAGQLGSAKEERVVNGKRKSLPVLTDIGREYVRGIAWCKAHPDRGELHTPVALLWDFHAGWAPPRHLYTGETFLVWGNMPYEKGDHQIDLVLRELYPGYPDAGFYHSEQGFLTSTPCGDSFDVLLSDAPQQALARYECIVVLGETKIEGELLARLAAYVESGGHLVASAGQLGHGAARLFGVEAGAAAEANHAMIPDHPWPINEPRFRYTRLTWNPGAVLLAHTRQGDPLVVSKAHGSGGSTLLFAADRMLSNPVCSQEHIPSELDQPISSPYALLEHVKAVLLPHLRRYSLVEIDGPPIQYLVNLTERTDRLVVTLCNNSPQTWTGSVRPRGPGIKRALNWMSGKRLPGRDGIRMTVPPLDVVVVEFLLDGPAFEVKR